MWAVIDLSKQLSELSVNRDDLNSPKRTKKTFYQRTRTKSLSSNLLDDIKVFFSSSQMQAEGWTKTGNLDQRNSAGAALFDIKVVFNNKISQCTKFKNWNPSSLHPSTFSSLHLLRNHYQLHKLWRGTPPVRMQGLNIPLLKGKKKPKKTTTCLVTDGQTYACGEYTHTHTHSLSLQPRRAIFPEKHKWVFSEMKRSSAPQVRRLWTLKHWKTHHGAHTQCTTANISPPVWYLLGRYDLLLLKLPHQIDHKVK